MSETIKKQIRRCFSRMREDKDHPDKVWNHVFFLQGYLFSLMDCGVIDWKLYEKIMKTTNKITEIV